MSFSVRMVPVSRSSTYVMDILIALMDLMNTTVQLVRVDCLFGDLKDVGTGLHIIISCSYHLY